MLKLKAKSFTFFTLAILTIITVSCKSNTDDDLEVHKPVEITTESTTQVTENTTEATEEITEATKEAEEATDSTELSIHIINEDTLETEEKPVNIDKTIELTPQVLVDKVVNELADVVVVGIDYVKTEDSSVIVSFKSDKAPLYNVGSGIEFAILDSISNTLLDNLEFCNEVIFRAEGKPYESGHVELGLNEAYATK